MPPRRGAAALPWAACLLALMGVALGGGRTYKEGEVVDMFANKVGPFANPSETYQFYTLPLCSPRDDSEEKILGLGEVLLQALLVGEVEGV